MWGASPRPRPCSRRGLGRAARRARRPVSNWASCCTRYGDRARARDLFDRFIDYYNQAAGLTAAELTAVGRALFRLSRWNYEYAHDALRALDEAVAAGPLDHAARLATAELFLERYDAREAAAAFGRILEENPAHAARASGAGPGRAAGGGRQPAGTAGGRARNQPESGGSPHAARADPPHGRKPGPGAGGGRARPGSERQRSGGPRDQGRLRTAPRGRSAGERGSSPPLAVERIEVEELVFEGRQARGPRHTKCRRRSRPSGSPPVARKNGSAIGARQSTTNRLLALVGPPQACRCRRSRWRHCRQGLAVGPCRRRRSAARTGRMRPRIPSDDEPSSQLAQAPLQRRLR